MESASNTPKPIQKDADDVFGEYVTYELKDIKDEGTKQRIKFQKQSIIYSTHAGTQIPMMLGPHNYAIYPNNTDMHGNWSGPLSSRSSTSHTRDSTP